MNRQDYQMLSESLRGLRERRLRQKMMELHQQERAEQQQRWDEGAPSRRLDEMKRALELQMMGQALSASRSAAADRDLQREIEPIRAEQQNYDGQRAIVERQLADARARRSELEKQVADQRKLNWQMSPDNPANRRFEGTDQTATVTRKAGDVSATYKVPLADMERALGQSGYSSPYAGDIADLGRQIAEQKAEIAGGDTRTGFLGIGKSRQGVIDGATQRRLQLQAMELQDMLEKGTITQEEADRRAAVLMRR